MDYFFDHYVKHYQKENPGFLLPPPSVLLNGVDRERALVCRRVLGNAFLGYREGRKREPLERLLHEYRNYMSGCRDSHARDRYNAFVYRYMLRSHIGLKAIGARLGIGGRMACCYVGKALDELLMLCMGVPAMDIPETSGGADIVHGLIRSYEILRNMAGEYVFDLFPGRTELEAVKTGRQVTGTVMDGLTAAAEAYCEYCNDRNVSLDSEIRRAVVLERCLAGVPVSEVSSECGCSERTVYADIRENEKRIAALLFVAEAGPTGAGSIWKRRLP